MHERVLVFINWHAILLAGSIFIISSIHMVQLCGFNFRTGFSSGHYHQFWNCLCQRPWSEPYNSSWVNPKITIYFENINHCSTITFFFSYQFQFVTDYVKFYMRAAPYVIGLAMGYVIHRIKTEKIQIKLNKVRFTQTSLSAKGW